MTHILDATGHIKNILDKPTLGLMVTFEGAVGAGSNSLRFYNKSGKNRTLVRVFLAINTSPDVQELIVDVHRNGNSIFTNQAHRPRIAAGAFTGQSDTIDSAVWADGDYLQVSVDQAGSTTGADLTVHIYYL